MTDERMLRNGSIDSVERDTNNTDSTTTTTAATTASTVPITTAVSDSVNVNSPVNEDGNNNENALASPSHHTSSQNDRRSPHSHSPITDSENGNSSTSTTTKTTTSTVASTTTTIPIIDQLIGTGGPGTGCTSNGNYSPVTANGSNANSKQPNYTNSNNGSPLHNPCGGRLQFFKDGKFILELARSKEGDQRGWISVPRKTYWPPAAALSQNNLNNHKNESSTSLSFSDDNSSIQSSPWQRDHNWKQLSPRKNTTKDLNFYYYRPMALVLNDASKRITKCLRRRPPASGDNKRNNTFTNHSVQYVKRVTAKASKIKLERKESNDSISSSSSKSNNDPNGAKSNELTKDKTNNKKDHKRTATTAEDIVDSPNVKNERNTSDLDGDEKMDCAVNDECNSKSTTVAPSKLAKDDVKNFAHRTRTKPIVNWKRQMRQRSKIGSVIEKLIARVADNPISVNATQMGLGALATAAGGTTAATRSTDLFSPHQHLSPRKRMLKDFTEKVSLDDRGSTTSTQKRLRSKSNASTLGDLNASSSGKPNYSIVVAHHTANIACNDKESLTHRIANGSPPRSNSNANENREKSSRSSSSTSSLATTAKSHNEVTSTPPVSKPISNYSIKSLLGHHTNSSSNNNHHNDSRMENNHDSDRMSAERGSPRSNNHPHYPHHPHQIISTSSAATSNRPNSTSTSSSSYVPKKKSPTNALINSPTHYRNARSPDTASLSSPTPSSFHPYLSSPLSSGTSSPNDLYRHRAHPYANGSPTAFTGSSSSNRYSPISQTSSTKTSPNSNSSIDRSSVTMTQPHQSHTTLSTAFNVSNLLPQSYERQQQSPPNAKPAQSRSIVDWSPSVARSPTNSHSSNNNNSNISSTTSTATKKTALFRQKYGSSLSPNGYAYGESSSSKKQLTSVDGKRPKTPPDTQRSRPTQQDYEKEMQAARYAEMAAMHQMALQQQAAATANPFYMASMHGAQNLPPSMAAAAAYINPLYYHHPSAGEMFRKTAAAQMDLLHKNLVHPWMDPYSVSSLMQHYPKAHDIMPPQQPPLSAYGLSNRTMPGARDQSGADIEMWNVADAKTKSPITLPTSAESSAFQRHSQQFSDCEPISLVKDEQSSDVPLNLSKH